MNRAILDEDGTVMQFVGDAVMACFGAPVAAGRSRRPRVRGRGRRCSKRRSTLDAAWAERGLPPFGLGIGLSTGPVAAALLGSEERLEYTLVGDTVNLAQRLQDLARPADASCSAKRRAAALDVRPPMRSARRAGDQGPPGSRARVQVPGGRSCGQQQEEHHDRREPDPRDAGTAQDLRVRRRARSARCAASTSR